MRLAKVIVEQNETRIVLVNDDHVVPLDLNQVEQVQTLSDILHSPDPLGLARFLVQPDSPQIEFENIRWLAPIDDQEVWAAGVTYKRSQQARMQESATAASHYDLVYTADRPELFLKATPSRVVHPGQPVRVRFDSHWSVPEPELALCVTPELKLAGFTVGNDMSARDIEGANPLYLPQAKVYRQCCSLGPAVLIPEGDLDLAGTKIVLTINRSDATVFQGETNLGEMARDLNDLISWLGRENDFPNGAILLTGTGIVPPDEFTLENGDDVSIEITGIGELRNPVVQESDG